MRLPFLAHQWSDWESRVSWDEVVVSKRALEEMRGGLRDLCRAGWKLAEINCNLNAIAQHSGGKGSKSQLKWVAISMLFQMHIMNLNCGSRQGDDAWSNSFCREMVESEPNQDLFKVQERKFFIHPILVSLLFLKSSFYPKLPKKAFSYPNRHQPPLFLLTEFLL